MPNPAGGQVGGSTGERRLPPGGDTVRPVADVIVVGGGVIGLSLAWRLAAKGAEVAVCDPEPGSGASWAAAGMLAPVTESRVGEPELTALCVDSLARWPAFARQLEEASGCPVGMRTEGTLAVGVDDDDRRALDHLHAVHRALGMDSAPLTGRSCREIEPLLTPRVRAGLDVPGDHQVDNRLLVGALQAACAKEGCRIHPHQVESVAAAAGRVTGVVLDSGEEMPAPTVVVAAGCGSSGVAMPAGVDPLPIRPVKGQIMRLRAPAELLPTRILRALVRGTAVYLVPRASGEVVVGGTVEEKGFDTAVTAGGVEEILRSAIEVVPAVSEMQLVDVIARLRPATPDNGPILGAGPVDGLFYAAGHYRNGVLLTPVTAEVMAAVVEGEASPPVAAPFSWERFA